MQVPHYRQSNPGACLPACARMVLAALGHTHTEAELAQAMGSYSFGTPAGRVTGLQQLGYQVTYSTATLDDLRSHLANKPKRPQNLLYLTTAIVELCQALGEDDE